MNITNFESYFRSPELAQQFIDRISEQLSSITFAGKIKIDEVKPKILGGAAAFSTKKYRARNKFQVYWLKISAMGKVSLRGGVDNVT